MSIPVTVRYLEVGYQGYFMGRIATDPDPTNERMGISGYTIALQGEPVLDQSIHLQYDPDKLRRPGRGFERFERTVTVDSVRFDGNPADFTALLGAKVSLTGADSPLPSPTFESRNNITGSDETMAFVITPYNLEVRGDDDALLLSAKTVINPADPEQKIWQVDDPAIYKDLLPDGPVETDSQYVNKLTGVFDYYEYFKARRKWLLAAIAMLEFCIGFIEVIPVNDKTRATELMEEMDRSGATLPEEAAWLKPIRDVWVEKRSLDEVDLGSNPIADAEREILELAAQQYRTRLYNLEFWGDRVISRMGLKLNWDHFTKGVEDSTFKTFTAEGQTWQVDFNRPWRTQYWFGAYDGDLLLGYHQGTLFLPCTPV